MSEIFGGVIFLMLMVILGGIVYKYRFCVKRYLNDPKYGSAWEPDRQTILKRRLEDTNAEIEWLKDPAETGD